jgi:hypothetical protein
MEAQIKKCMFLIINCFELHVFNAGPTC